MEKILILIIAILPVFLIGLFIYKKDRDKESKRLLIKLFLLGIVSSVPALIMEMTWSHFWPEPSTERLIILFFYVLLKVGLSEEICKWFMVYKNAYNDREFDHLYDAIVYSVFVSLGFAGFENIFYVFEGGMTAGLIRSVTAIPCHAINAIFMGNFLGLAKKSDIKYDKKTSTKYKILSIIIPALMHGIYDFCLYAENLIFFIIFIIFVILIYIYGIFKVVRTAKITNNIYDDEDGEVSPIEEVKNDKINNYFSNHCPVCGNLIDETTGNKCDRCGADLIR